SPHQTRMATAPMTTRRKPFPPGGRAAVAMRYAHMRNCIRIMPHRCLRSIGGTMNMPTSDHMPPRRKTPNPSYTLCGLVDHVQTVEDDARWAGLCGVADELAAIRHRIAEISVLLWGREAA